jgi:hypothetical protein
MLEEKDRMGSAAYFCPTCRKTIRPEAAAVRAEGDAPDSLREWRSAKRLLIGVCVGGFLLTGLLAALLITLSPGRSGQIGKSLATLLGIAIVVATYHAESARRRARRAEGKDPDKHF